MNREINPVVVAIAIVATLVVTFFAFKYGMINCQGDVETIYEDADCKVIRYYDSDRMEYRQQAIPKQPVREVFPERE